MAHSGRPNLNFIEGANVDITLADNPGLKAVDVTVAVPSVPSDPALDPAVWMPLTTTVGGDDVLVFDADDSLVPTLVPF
jgi:hypothetical protein